LNTRSRWVLLLAGLLSVALVFAAACDDDDDNGEPTPATGETPIAGDRMQGGELVVQGLEFESLDPHFSAFAQDISLQRMLWRGLMWLDEHNEPQPHMAAAQPDVSDDGLTYTFTLHDGLLWSDGEPLTAGDFEYGIKRTCNPENAGQYQYLLTNIVGCDAHYYNEEGFDRALEGGIGVTAVDDTTLEVTIGEQQPTFATTMSLWLTFPAPAHLFETTGDEWPTDPAALAYNGPYVLTEYVPQDSVTLEPNENWAAPNGISPTLDRIVIRFIDNFSRANDAYRTDELQFARVDTTQLQTIISEFGEGDEYFSAVLPVTAALFLQLDQEALSDVDVRLALARSINRVEMVELVAQGAHIATTSWIPEVTSGVAHGTFDDLIGYDPDAARQHLEDAGYPDGEGFPQLTILIRDDPQAVATAEFLQEDFQEILGINVSIERVDAQTRGMRFGQRNFELFPAGWQQDYADPENWILGLFETGGSLNNFGCSVPEIDEQIESARFNTNNDERVRLYREIEELVLENVCGIIPYWHERAHYLIKPDVVGMRDHISGQDAFQAGDWIAEAWGLAAN
jgi:oligopeptide transport system substrate-binding protein